jgi:hypothetical protein
MFVQNVFPLQSVSQGLDYVIENAYSLFLHVNFVFVLNCFNHSNVVNKRNLKDLF